MYLIDKQNNRIKNLLKERKFGELGFKERQHLQQWIAESPEILGEELLIIQQEFDGFNDTNERLDLLALDKDGNIVVIENKLDDTGRDVTWQVLKYASYCSTLTKDNIRKIYQDYLDKQGRGEQATEKIAEFFDNAEYEEIALNQRQTQRIMMVAGSYRKEVTSTVLWLLNYKLRVQCFKASIYSLGEELILDVEQIIPTKDAADYIISMADKTQEDLSTQAELRERHHIRLEFWNQLLPRFKGKTPIYQNTSPSKDHWLSSGGTGISGVYYSCIITRSYAGVEVAIAKGTKEENKEFFDELIKHKEQIELKFGHELNWERLDDKKMSRVSYHLQGVSIFEKEDWPQMLEFLVSNMILLEEAMRDILLKVKKKLKA
jgi:hypothetical protein